MGLGRAGAEADRTTKRPLHFVFRVRMRQLSPLTHRSSIRFCTQSSGRIKRTRRHRCTPRNVSIGIDRRSIDSPTSSSYQRRAALRQIFCNNSVESCLPSRSCWSRWYARQFSSRTNIRWRNARCLLNLNRLDIIGNRQDFLSTRHWIWTLFDM